MPVLPRPTSLMTTYLPILSGMRPPGLGIGTDLEAGSVIGWRDCRDGASGYGVARSSDCDVSLTRFAATAAAAPCGRRTAAALSAEMLVTRMRELHHSTAVAHHHGAELGAQLADARIAPLLRRQLCGEARDILRRHSET